jgi:hypothetical protein
MFLSQRSVYDWLSLSIQKILQVLLQHGLMMMTFVSLPCNVCLLTLYTSWVTAAPAPDDQCFEAIKAGIDVLPAGTKMFLNSGKHIFFLSWSRIQPQCFLI